MIDMSFLNRIARGLNRWHSAFAVLLTVLFLFLAVRTHDNYYWSDTGSGDAQTMLSLRQWEEGGWFSNYFLFKPQGYAPVVDMLDEPALRHHAHGTSPFTSKLGPRLWYTHYPPGYLIPFAFLSRQFHAKYGHSLDRLVTIFGFLYSLFQVLLKPAWLFLVFFAMYAVYPRFFANRDGAFPSTALLGVLFLCGMAPPPRWVSMQVA